ncbi:Putative calcineurin-like phosphoesterase domain, ApaH type, metallo-dependent phosphatase [Septoria linicola]|uniref:Calcineurin-like phosphoesterase domain, ApaH type, metallo-dependent phosphatase n=1 Tax=Septoria linicola TaxID=215465 RepID=A0A9Q9AKM1_9PEZI|nr:putative calcineurin-like phosphoesterase domain, ApaH type, metallo-dependent phosphatase [Septoria linicola]USW47802.1 Putative calcineurin-like phosphoesterase domain, ApaH type, metallo-dependent phosphatase [Septoria linicola]
MAQSVSDAASTASRAGDGIRTTIWIISDTHGAPLGDSSSSLPFQAPLPKVDLLLHCGDLTMNGGQSQYEDAIDMIASIDASVKLVIAGNHDYSLDEHYMKTHLEKTTSENAQRTYDEARKLWTAEDGRAKREGITFLDEGLHVVSLKNGAELQVYASPYTPEYLDWGFPYEQEEDRFNAPLASLRNTKNIAISPIPSRSDVTPVDIIMTHGPPLARLDRTHTGQHVGCPHLLRAVMRCRPRLHAFGHIHEGHGIERVQWSPEAGSVVSSPQTLSSWNDGAWRQGVLTAEHKSDAAHDRRCNGIFVDVSSASDMPLRQSEETLFVNAAIMDVEPSNAPSVITMDLPRA